MIPQQMNEHLKKCLGESVLKNRTRNVGGLCYLELYYTDDHLLSQLGITRDSLGPHMVACIWDETSPVPIGGYVVVDNLSMGAPSMGGTRMLADITPADIHNLARGMTLKNGAADLPYGGGKSGIVADPGHSPEQHTQIVRGFARLIKRYSNIYVPGPDVGTNDADMRTIAAENGIDSAVSKPADMGGNRIDELGGAAGGVVIALQTLLKIMPRLKVLPQFANLQIPNPEELTVLIQGFGAVGAHAARIMKQRLPEASVVGISDLEGYLYDESGLPVEPLFELWQNNGLVSTSYYKNHVAPGGHKFSSKFSSHADNLLRENAFCMVPAAAVFDYLDVTPSGQASMTVDRMGQWSLIVEGANTYSPDPNRKAVRMRMEQEVYRRKGVMIANDYLVNSGGVIFAAQEHIVPTPSELQIPENMLGDEKAVESWLKKNEDAFAELSAKRLAAGEDYREKVIRRNMVELVDLLASDADMLPCKAAERISLQRLSKKENERTAKDIMEPIPVAGAQDTIQYAASLIIETRSHIVAVQSPENMVVGIITSWDITKAIAKGINADACLQSIMTTKVISSNPNQRILEIVRELQQHKISEVPVIDDKGQAVGKVGSDLLAARLLLPILQAQEPA
ncbi:MAG: CBS domain-containing protein [Desulfobacteraceae bacterium]|nr:CBS domain-containing protein [Desulfobacteraceae bacterium]